MNITNAPAASAGHVRYCQLDPRRLAQGVLQWQADTCNYPAERWLCNASNERPTGNHIKIGKIAEWKIQNRRNVAVKLDLIKECIFIFRDFPPEGPVGGDDSDR